MPSMRVGLLSNAGRIGGGNRSLLTLAVGLHSRGVEPTVFCPEDGEMADATRSLGIGCEVTSYGQPEWRRPIRTWRDTARWDALLGRARVDLVHANSVDAFRSVSLAARRRRLGALCHVRYPPGPDGVAWMSRGLPTPAVCIFNSHALLAETGTSFSRACPRAELVVVHNAVDLSAFTARPPHAAGDLRIGIVANLLPVKGHFEFLEMAKRLIARGLSARFLVIGQDVLRTGFDADVRARAAALDLSTRVDFTGFVRDVPSLMRTLDIAVSASHEEPFGRSVLEAMACQVPVVATRVGGVPEVVEDGVTGTLVPPRDPQALADAVWALAVDAELRQRMGVAGRDRATRRFGVPAHVEQVVGLYERVLAAR
jgi:glycosyltransferase involved in cell wall biosynthesis